MSLYMWPESSEIPGPSQVAVPPQPEASSSSNEVRLMCRGHEVLHFHLPAQTETNLTLHFSSPSSKETVLRSAMRTPCSSIHSAAYARTSSPTADGHMRCRTDSGCRSTS
eukprot:365930-Chlamydomonas_euryale.AAC.15